MRKIPNVTKIDNIVIVKEKKTQTMSMEEEK